MHKNFLMKLSPCYSNYNENKPQELRDGEVMSDRLNGPKNIKKKNPKEKKRKSKNLVSNSTATRFLLIES